MKRYFTCLLIALFLLANPLPSMGKLAPGDFIDIHGHWAEQEIQMTCNQGLMMGTGKTQGFRIFAPESTVDRAQLAAVLVRTFQLDYGDKRFIKQPVASDYYRDVDNQAWYADAVVFCTINDVFTADKYFHPTQAVSRIELAQAVEQSFKAKGISIPMIMMMPSYRDMDGLSQEETTALVFVSNTSIMKGDSENFRPRQAVKRAELARVLNRCTSLMSIDESYNNQEYTMPTGKSFVLSLVSNPSTGYTWTLADSGDKSLLKLVDESFEPGSTTNLVGQAGKSHWKFTALKTGTTEIKLVYARPWESVQPAKTFNLTVIVTPPATRK